MFPKLRDMLKKHSYRDGFSLVEIVMALGIISFAIVGIMGLFPVAMRSALESQRETRAAQIAQQIFSDLRAGRPSSTYIAIQTNILNSSSRQTVNLGSPQALQVFYTGEGQPAGTAISSDASFAADITVIPNAPISGLSSVFITIKSPPSDTNRTYKFSTLMSQQ